MSDNGEIVTVYRVHQVLNGDLMLLRFQARKTAKSWIPLKKSWENQYYSRIDHNHGHYFGSAEEAVKDAEQRAERIADKLAREQLYLSRMEASLVELKEQLNGEN
jgi:hypothetical protein